MLGYQPALDGLRALAIAGVVGFHTFGWPQGGGLGVDLFFVLSGFLITTLLVEEREQTGTVSLRGFYMRRARRLIPAFAVMVLAYLVITAIASSGEFVRGLVGSASGIGYVANLNAAFGWWAMPVSLEHTWSLAAEEQFYLVWPLLLMALLTFHRRGAARTVALVLVAAIAWQAYVLVAAGFTASRATFAPDARSLVPLLVGCLAALKQSRWRGSELVGRAGSVALMALVLLMLPMHTSRLYGNGLYPAFALLAALAIGSAVDTASNSARSVLSATPLVCVGRISYSLYLWHMPVLVAFHVEGHAGRGQGGFGRQLLALSVALVAAGASYLLVEQRFRRRRAVVSVRPVPVPAS